MVTRDELIKKVWPSNTFVDFEHSLNAAINRLRHILDDAAERPRYIETVPKRGYRWLCQIQRQSNGETTPNALMTGYKLTRSFEDFGSLSAEPVIAVLPFADISPTRDSNYFCDGLAEEITSV